MFTSVVPVSPQRHAGQGWRRWRAYGFAAGTALVPLVGAEFPKAVHAFPIAFKKKEDGFAPVAVLGLEPGRNLFVAADGRWLGSYIPARLRGYPFVQARAEDGCTVMCIDEDSGLLTADPEGEPLFDAEGGLSAAVQGIADFLREVEQNRSATRAAVARLAEAGVIVPWSLSVTLAGEQRTITGLYTVDEAALTALPDAAFLTLRQNTALTLAYAQPFSRAQVPLLEKLATAHAQGDDQRRQRLAGSFVDEPADDLAFNFGGIG